MSVSASKWLCLRKMYWTMSRCWPVYRCVRGRLARYSRNFSSGDCETSTFGSTGNAPGSGGGRVHYIAPGLPGGSQVRGRHLEFAVVAPGWGVGPFHIIAPGLPGGSQVRGRHLEFAVVTRSETGPQLRAARLLGQ